jgi:hypothetical protein
MMALLHSVASNDDEIVGKSSSIIKKEKKDKYFSNMVHG